MKEKTKSFFKHIPILNKYIRLLKDGKKINSTLPHKLIEGKDNSVKIDDSVLLSNCTFDIVGNNNEIEICESSMLKNVTFYIRGDNNKIRIAKNVRFMRGGEIWIEDTNCEANIGEYSSFQDTHIAVTEPNSKIDIGKDCMFAYDIDLRTGDSHSIIDSKTQKRINYAKSIIVVSNIIFIIR